jgi:hypothetical protein
VGILAAGQSSTMTGTYSGQFAMEVSHQWPFLLCTYLLRKCFHKVMNMHMKLQCPLVNSVYSYLCGEMWQVTVLSS